MSTVDVAADYAARLLRSEARGPGDTEEAMRRLEAKYGLPYWTQWALRYKRPKSVNADIFNRIRSAYLTFCERQVSVATHNLLIEQSKGRANDFSDLVAEAEGLVEKIKAAQEAVR